jgi:membrane protein YdbS with pleckstrin-like domain
MEGRLPFGLIFAVLTAAAVWYFWKAEGSNFNVYAAVATLVVMAVLVFLLQGKRFHGPPIGEEIKQRQAEIAAAEAAASKAAAAG